MGISIKYKTLIYLFFIFFAPGFVCANSPSANFNFTQDKDIISIDDDYIFLIQNQDDPLFSTIEYDDSKWPQQTLPASWTNEIFPGFSGVCWYRFHFTLKGAIPSALGFYIGQISDADEFFLNGEIIGRTGSIEDLSGHAYDRSRIYFLPKENLRDGENVISIRVRNFFSHEAGIIRGPIFIGNYRSLLIKYGIRELQNVILSVVFFIVFGYFIIFFIRVSSDKYALYFSLFSLFLSIYLFLISDFKYLLSDNFLFMKRIEYLTLFNIALFFLEFILSYFKQKRTLVFKIPIFIVGGACIIVLMVNNIHTWSFINKLLIQPCWAIYSILIYIILFKNFKNRNDTKLLTSLSMFFFFCLTIEVLIFRNIINLSFYTLVGSLTGYGALIFISGIAYILIDKYVKAHEQVSHKTGQLKESLILLNKANNEVESAYFEAIHRVALVAEHRDQETGEHIKRVSLYVRFIAERLGLDDKTITDYQYASLMHDVGKVGIPDEILFKTEPLNAKEWAIMKKHTVIGSKIFETAYSPVLIYAKEITLSHHEKWDGSGYPNKLRGDQIPLVARILTVADVYDALRSKRPYKNELPHKTVLKIMTEGDNRVSPEGFDPTILKIFIDNDKEFEHIFEKYRDS